MNAKEKKFVHTIENIHYGFIVLKLNFSLNRLGSKAGINRRAKTSRY